MSPGSNLQDAHFKYRSFGYCIKFIDKVKDIRDPPDVLVVGGHPLEPRVPPPRHEPNVGTKRSRTLTTEINWFGILQLK